MSGAAISFVLSMYTFNTARIVAPLLVFGLAVGCSKELFRLKKQTIVSAVIGCLLLLPIIPFLLSPQAQLRFKEVNIFSDVKIVTDSNQAIANDHGAWWSKIIHNRRVGYSIAFMNHYLDNLKPDFLFIKGDGNPKFSTQSVGQMYIWELPFLIVGIFMLFKKREGRWWIIPYWLLVSIIPAATARETPHALRIEATLPTFQILVAFGLISTATYQPFAEALWRKWKIAAGSLALIILVSLAYFLHGYYMHYPYEFSGEWQYGYKQAIAYVASVQDTYDEVRMTTELGRPYAYYLFYLQTPPRVFRQTALIRRDPFGFVDIDGFDKYRFMADLSDKRDGDKNILYVGGKTVPKNANILKTINLLNGKPALIIYTL
jgi:hypothetical protein